MFWQNPWSARGTSHHAAFLRNWPTIIHTFLALFTQWMSSPSWKLGLAVSPRFHLVVFVPVVNQEKWGAEEFQDSAMVSSFSADLPAIESHWTEWHLEFCGTSTTEFLCESMSNAFR